jgi:hypothetical protein
MDSACLDKQSVGQMSTPCPAIDTTACCGYVLLAYVSSKRAVQQWHLRCIRTPNALERIVL